MNLIADQLLLTNLKQLKMMACSPLEKEEKRATTT
jgi:hypothetical protein